PIVGVASWQLAAAAITGFIAKENVVGTLAVCFAGLHNLIDTEELQLMDGAGEEVASVFAITKIAALAYLMFNLFTPPCFAAMGAMNSEMKSAKWFWGGIGFQMGVGFTVSYIVYQIGTLIITGSFGNGFIGGLIAVLVFVTIIVALILKSDKKLKEEKADKIKEQIVTK
ncbi:MAG: nucleoside recognition domain-containing protein, partial [Acutalibacteraceae bacterium]|nr:nucleoside recognition domain-containing protein [Acutalibacteraceae bacterium]